MEKGEHRSLQQSLVDAETATPNSGIGPGGGNDNQERFRHETTYSSENARKHTLGSKYTAANTVAAIDTEWNHDLLETVVHLHFHLHLQHDSISLCTYILRNRRYGAQRIDREIAHRNAFIILYIAQLSILIEENTQLSQSPNYAA